MIFDDTPTAPSLSAKLLDRLDAMKGDFLSVPANIRAASDLLARVRRELNKTPTAATVNETAQRIEANLQRVKAEWNTSAERFTQLDTLRRGGAGLTLGGVAIASQLAISAVYVQKNATASIQAVDAFANAVLTPEQLSALRVKSVGVAAGMSLPLLALAGVGMMLAFRSRR